MQAAWHRDDRFADQQHLADNLEGHRMVASNQDNCLADMLDLKVEYHNEMV